MSINTSSPYLYAIHSFYLLTATLVYAAFRHQLCSQIAKIKVKISNLSYSSTEVAITRLCERYGPVTEVNLLMDENKRSRGRAYITFEVGGDGESFMEKMNEKSFEGRVLRISAAVERKKGRESFGGKGDMSRTRYWEKDITTKCFRCGKIGHMVRIVDNGNMFIQLDRRRALM